MKNKLHPHLTWRRPTSVLSLRIILVYRIQYIDLLSIFDFFSSAPDQPNDVKVTRVTPTSAVVSWDGEHRGILDDYVVETTPDGASVSLVNGNPTHPSRRLDDLIPGIYLI